MKKQDIRDRIFAAREAQIVEVEAFGATIRLQKLDWATVQRTREVSVDSEGKFDRDKNAIALLTFAAVDEDGEHIFEPRDLEDLKQSDGEELDKLVMANWDLQGLTRSAAKAGKGA